MAVGTAWGELEFTLGSGPSGVAKQGSYSLEYQEGERKEWRAIGGRLLDARTMPGTIRVTYELKNIAVGDFKAVGDGKDTTLTITPKDKIGESLSFKKGTVTLAPIFVEDGAYGTKVTYTALPSEDNVLFTVADSATTPGG